MLTPRFNLKQDNDFVLIKIHAPYSNPKDNECLIEDYDFIFYASPYFLRLRLPGKLKDSDKCKGAFDGVDQTYSLKIEKENPGEFFEDLGMITNFLIPPVEPTMTPKFDSRIEVVSSTTIEGETDANENDSAAENVVVTAHGYGFGNKITSKFDAYDTFSEVFDCRPDIVDCEDRRNKRINSETSAFSSDHYLADRYDLEYIDDILKYAAPWQKRHATAFDHDNHQFTGHEIDLLKELPNKEYIFNSEERNNVLIGIVDIVYPLMYEYRTTASDLSPESSWTINKLSATLSWFESFSKMDDCVSSLMRRSLIYPLYRNYDLSVTVLDDVKTALRLGKAYIIKLFIEIHSLFNSSQACRYILNDLYIKDYLIFIQKTSEGDMDWLRTELDKINVSKDKLHLELSELEEAAEMVKNDSARDYEGLVHLMNKCGRMSAVETDSDDDTRASDESEDSSSGPENDSSSEESSR